MHIFNNNVGNVLAKIENPSKTKLTFYSLYRPDFFGICFSSEVYAVKSRRLLADWTEIPIVLNANAEAHECKENAQCKIIIPLGDLQLQELDISNIYLRSQQDIEDTTTLAELCLGSNCLDKVVISKNTTNPAVISPQEPEQTSEKTNTSDAAMITFATLFGVCVVGILGYVIYRVVQSRRNQVISPGSMPYPPDPHIPGLHMNPHVSQESSIYSQPQSIPPYGQGFAPDLGYGSHISDSNPYDPKRYPTHFYYFTS